LSVATWYICPIGRRVRFHCFPRVVEIETPPSLPIIMRRGSFGSDHMSWLSPPQRIWSEVSPPSYVKPMPLEGK
jgi:hypothetical protein